jgi:hypothetical protein
VRLAEGSKTIGGIRIGRMTGRVAGTVELTIFLVPDHSSMVLVRAGIIFHLFEWCLKQRPTVRAKCEGTHLLDTECARRTCYRLENKEQKEYPLGARGLTAAFLPSLGLARQ